jgi:predicted RNase H-like nuclease (RuvC/YqgF family)
LAHKKQPEIDDLQNSICNLQRDIQDSAKVKKREQAQLKYLQNQLAELNQQKSDLHTRLQYIADYARRQESEVSKLQIEKSQVNSHKSELQIQFQALYQKYEQQTKEIANLKEQIKNPSKINRTQLSSSTYTTSQQPIKETRTQITPEEYKGIFNKNDYVYVKSHQRNGSSVKAYYRRKPNK